MLDPTVVDTEPHTSPSVTTAALAANRPPSRGDHSTVLSNIQFLRAVAILLVLVFHAAGAEGTKPFTTPFLSWALYFGYGGVNLFFVISGFIIAWINRPYLGQPAAIGGYLQRRFLRIFPIYWICVVGVYAVEQIGLGKPDPFFGVPLGEIASQLLLSPLAGSYFIGPAWSLAWEIVFYGVFTLFLLVPPRWFALCLGLLTLVIGANVMTAGSRLPFQPLFSVILLNFVLGVVVAQVTIAPNGGAAGTCVVIGTIWFFASGWVNAQGWLSTESNPHRLLEFGCSSSLIVYGLASLEVHRGVVVRPALTWIGDASYSIYLTHACVFLLLRRATAKLSLDAWPHLTWIALLLGGGLLVGFVVYRCAEKPLLGWFKRRRDQRWQLMNIALAVAACYLGLCVVATVRYREPVLRLYTPIAGDGYVMSGDGPATGITHDGVALRRLDASAGVLHSTRINIRGRLLLSGYAEEPVQGIPAAQVVIFLEGRQLVATAPSRWDRLGHPRSHSSGFYFSLPGGFAEVDAHSRIRAFALIGSDNFAELARDDPGFIDDRPHSVITK
jgi:peptidoglycan/LPS O-acetylase OafA/YrhL